MAAPRARKQQHQQHDVITNPVDGTAFSLDDEDGNTQQPGSCALAQLLAGACAAFLFSVVGIVFTGDGGRSTLWALGLIIGSTVGTYVTRASVGGDGNDDGEDICST